MSASLPPAIVCDADKLSQVAVIQELGRAGVPVEATALDRKAVGFASRHLSRRHLLTEPSHTPEFVDRLLREVPPGVLVPSNDPNVENLSRHRDLLQERGFRLLVPPPETVSRVLDKRLLAKAASECRISVPPDTPIDGEGSLPDAAREIGYPLIIKTSNLAGGVYRLVRREEELLPRFRELAEEIRSPQWRHRNANLFLQRWIDTGDALLWNFNALAEGGEIRSWSMGVRIRTNRRRDGTIGSSLLFGETRVDAEILEANRRLLRHLRFDGILETEWSRGSNGESPYLYDFNPRPSGNIRWVFRSGVPMALQYYSICAGIPCSFDTPMKPGVRYHKVLYREDDFLLSLEDPALRLRDCLGILKEDLASLLGSREHAVDILDPDDPMPSIRAIAPLPLLAAKAIAKSVLDRFA